MISILREVTKKPESPFRKALQHTVMISFCQTRSFTKISRVIIASQVTVYA